MIRTSLTFLGALGLVSLVACSGDTTETPETPAGPETPAEPAPPPEPPEPVQDPIEGGPYPTLMLSQAWFMDTDAGPVPGPARLHIWRQGPDGWAASRLEDADSNVFHKAILNPEDSSILTIGAERAILKRWTLTDGAWSGEILWEQSWGGKYNRLRDLEIGDVDGDGADEWVIATHDAGVVAVYEPADGTVIELDKKADTFTHEIEIGDIDGDGTDELFSVQEAQLGAAKQIVKPVEVRQYTLQDDGSFEMKTVVTIQDRQTRFLVPGDFDGDGRLELIAAAYKTGVHLIDSEDGETWTRTLFETNSSGFEHASYAADLDGDGTPELYVAADEQRELKRFTWNAEAGKFDRELIGKIEPNSITWNIEAGTL